MNQNTTLFLGLALFILLKTGYAVIGQITHFEAGFKPRFKTEQSCSGTIEAFRNVNDDAASSVPKRIILYLEPQSDYLKFELAEGKIAALSQRNKNLIPEVTVGKNSTIIKFRETIKNSETFTIQPLDQIIKMENNYDEVLVDLIRNITSLECYEGEELQFSGKKNQAATLINKQGFLYGDYVMGLFGCKHRPFDIWFERDKLFFGTEAIQITYDRPSKTVEIDNKNKEFIKINLASGSINNKRGEKLAGDKRAWHSLYGRVTFDDNFVLIVYGVFSLTINLPNKPYSVVMSSLQANLTETPTNVMLECGVGKVEMKKKDETIETMVLSNINGQEVKKSQIVLQKYATTLASAGQHTMIIKSQNEETPLLIQGMYGAIRVLPKPQLSY